MGDSKNFGLTPDIFDWRTLTSSINKIKAPKTLILDKLYPRSIQKFSEKIEFDVIVGNQKLAPFVNKGDKAKVIANMGHEKNIVSFPVIRLKKILTDLDMVVPAGMEVYSSSESINNARMIQIGNELKDLKERTIRRTEWMACESLKGKIEYQDEDTNVVIDFRMPAEHTPVLTGTAKWDQSTSKIIKDIKDWISMIVSRSGKAPKFGIVGKNVSQYLLENTDFLKLLDQKNVNVGSLDIQMRENGEYYLGSILGVPLFEYTEEYVNEADEVKSMIDSDSFVLTSGVDFERFTGLITDKKVKVAVAEEFFAKTWTEEDPPIEYILSESRPLVIPKRPESTVYAKVI